VTPNELLLDDRDQRRALLEDLESAYAAIGNGGRARWNAETDAAGWKLAAQLALADGKSEPDHSVAELRRIAITFEQLRSDPFGVLVHELKQADRMNKIAAEPTKEQTLAQLIMDLVETLTHDRR
jgi:hypothetical protein